MSDVVACAVCRAGCRALWRDARGCAVCRACRPDDATRAAPGYRGVRVPPGAEFDGLRDVLRRHTAAAIVAREAERSDGR